MNNLIVNNTLLQNLIWKNNLKVIGIVFFIFMQKKTMAQNGIWTWMKGDSVSNITTSVGKASYGIKGVEASTNEPPERYEPFYWIDKAGDFWLFGGVGINTELNDLWKFSTITNNWTWVSGDSFNHNFAGTYGTLGIASANNMPSARGWGGVSWTDNNGDLWLYGGAQLAGDFEDVWKYNIATNQWTWVKGSATAIQQANYGSTGIASPTNTPGSKSEIKAGWVDSENNLWMFGGTSYTQPQSKAFNDLWKFNTTTNEWTFIKGDKIPASLGKFGSKGIEADSNMPSARMSFNYWKDVKGQFYIFAGSSLAGSAQNDLWRFNTNTNNWTWLSGTDDVNSIDLNGNYVNYCQEVENVHGAMFENTAALTNNCSNQFWNFGNGNNLSSYDIITNKWTWVSGDDPLLFPFGNDKYGIKGIPSASNNMPIKNGMAMWVDNQNNLWVFGGGTTKTIGSGKANDLWRFQPDTTCYHPTIPQLIQIVLPTDTAICKGESIAIPKLDNVNYIILPAGSATFTTNQIILQPTNSIKYKIIATFVGTCNLLTDTLQLNVTVKEAPIASFTINPEIAKIDKPIFQFINESTNANSYQWMYNNTVFSTLKNTSKTFTEVGTYCVVLVAINDNQCIDSVDHCATIIADESIIVPSAFTPNGDINNDLLKIIGNNNNKIQFLIYDKWGNQVFATNNIAEAWNGSYGNKPCDIGTYFYIVSYIENGMSKSIKGDVTLIR